MDHNMTPNPENVDSFFVTGFEVYKGILSFQLIRESDCSQVHKDLISKPNGKSGNNFLKSFSKLLNLIGETNYPNN